MVMNMRGLLSVVMTTDMVALHMLGSNSLRVHKVTEPYYMLDMPTKTHTGHFVNGLRCGGGMLRTVSPAL